MKPFATAIRLLVIALLASAVCAQNATPPNNGAASPPGGKKPAENAAAASGGTGELQQKQEQPPAGVPQVAPREAGPSPEPGQMTLEFKFLVDGTMLQGNKSRSFLHEGINNTGDVNYLHNMPFLESNRFEIMMAARYTDNPRVDPERNSLQRGYMRFSGRHFELTFGDSLVNYSRFSFSQNIKGLNFWRDFNGKVKFTGTVGFFVDRWGSLYRDYLTFRDITNPLPPNPASPSKPYTRFVAGARMEKKVGRAGWWALNYSHGVDQLQYLPESLITCMDTTTLVQSFRAIGTGCLAGEVEVPRGRLPGMEGVENDVVSIDTNFEIQRAHLRVNGEIAYGMTSGGLPPAGATPTSFACTIQAPVVGAAVLDSRCFNKRERDPAYRFEVTQRAGPFNWRVDYSRFQPNFVSANARQIRDLQDFNVRTDYQWLKQVAVVASWRRSNDNLNGLRNYTSIVRAPEAKLVFRELPIYRRMSFEVGYRERNLDTAGTPMASCLNSAVVPSVITRRPSRTGCLPGETMQSTEDRRRSTRIPFFSLTLPVKSTMLTFDYEHRQDIDMIAAQNGTNTDRFAFGLRGNYIWGRWDVVPAFRFELERLDKNLPTNAALAPMDPSLLFPLNFFDARDSNRSFNASLMLEAPKYFRFEAIFREFNSVTLSPLRASAALDPLMRFFYFNQGFKRPNWHAALTYKIRNDENKLITAFWERSNNFFATGDPFVADSKSFRETVIGGIILIRFRR